MHAYAFKHHRSLQAPACKLQPCYERCLCALACFVRALLAVQFGLPQAQ
jgi:hypothetical protein